MNQRIETNYKEKTLPTEEEHEKRAREECSTFFRVLKNEYPKFFCLSILGFNISFIYSTLRDGKDTIVMSCMLPTSISFLKSTMVLLFTLIFGALFQVLIAKGFSMKKIMIGAHIGFGAYFAFYSIFIFGWRDLIEPQKYMVNDLFCDKKMFVNGLEALKGFLFIFNFWTSSMFYVSAEIWGSMVLSLLFFGCINEICVLQQALRFYPLFLIFTNIALMLSGVLGIVVSSIAASYAGFINIFYRGFLLFIACVCVGNIIIYKYLMEKIVPYPLYITTSTQPTKKSKTKVGVIAGIKAAFSNPIILSLSISVLAYGMVTNLTEGSTNSTITKEAEISMQDKGRNVMHTKAIQQIQIGLFTIFFLISPLKSFIQTKGWLSLGLLSPLFSLLGSILLFLIVWMNVQVDSSSSSGFFSSTAKSISSIFFTTRASRLKTEKYVGAFVVSMIKILKYAAFDICKEAIGVKIPKEHRSRFKGVYDGVFAKFGKSMSSTIQISLLGLYNTNDIRESVFILGTLIVLITCIWLYSSIYLGKEYTKAVNEGTDLPIVVKG